MTAAMPDGPTTPIADPRVAAALARIAESAGVDLDRTPGVLDDVYQRLQSALSSPERN